MQTFVQLVYFIFLIPEATESASQNCAQVFIVFITIFAACFPSANKISDALSSPTNKEMQCTHHKKAVIVVVFICHLQAKTASDLFTSIKSIIKYLHTIKLHNKKLV